MNRFLLSSLISYSVLLPFMAYGVALSGDVLVVSSQKEFNLSEDIIVSGNGSPFFATDSFGKYAPEKLIIKSSSARSVIIDKNSTWDLSSFSGKNKIIEFAGNARLVCRPGAKLIGKGGVLRFTDDSRWLVGKE